MSQEIRVTAIAWPRRLAAGLALLMALALATPAAASGPGSLAGVAKELLNAVVNISTAQTVAGSRGIPQQRGDNPFGELFDEFLDRDQNGRPSPRRVDSLGSGFVVDPEGLIVTNYHVIEGADEITTIFTDGSQLTATVIGHDPETDLALLKVSPSRPLVHVEFGRSDDVEIGDWVMAVGNPFGLGGTVTIGILSARNRDIKQGPFDDYLQTDAAINRGNSGGPLFNMEGQVIGVNTAIISPSGGSIGIGFAVPSEIAASVVNQLKEFGYARRGWLGVNVQDVDSDIAETIGLDRARGAMVTSVTEGGPAADAGLLVGDVILSFNGREVAEMRQLPRLVAENPVGEAARIEVLRDGKTTSVEVIIGELEVDKVMPAVAVVESDKAPDTNLLGLALSDITGTLKRRFDLGDNAAGVVVTDVARPSAASEKGIRPGDVIVEVGQEKVASPEAVNERLAALKKEGRRRVLLLLDRGKGDFKYVALSLE